MPLQSHEIAPAIYSDRLVIRACSTLIDAACEQLKKDTPHHMGEALDFTRNFTNQWEPEPDSVVAYLFDSNGTHGLVYDYDSRTIEKLDLQIRFNPVQAAPGRFTVE